MVNVTYTENDVAPVVIDGLVKLIVGVTIFASLIGLAFGLSLAYAMGKRAFGRR